MTTKQATKKRAILYAWDGDPADEVFADTSQSLAEEIGSAIHQMLEFDQDISEIRVQISEIRVQILDDVMLCPGCGKTASPETKGWVEREVPGPGGDYVSSWCPDCAETPTEGETDDE